MGKVKRESITVYRSDLCLSGVCNIVKDVRDVYNLISVHKKCYFYSTNKAAKQHTVWKRRILSVCVIREVFSWKVSPL